MAENIQSSTFYTWQPSYGSIRGPNEDIEEENDYVCQEAEEPHVIPHQQAVSRSSSFSSQHETTNYLDTFNPDISNNYVKGKFKM